MTLVNHALAHDSPAEEGAAPALSSAPRAVARAERTDEKRLRRLRARRLRIDELQLEGLEAMARHATLGAVSARVEDLSLTGAALVFRDAATRGALVLTGDRLERLELVCRGALLYQGDAHVRRISERGGDLVIGVEVQSGTIDLSELYRLGARHSFGERLEAVLDAGEDEVSNEFKVWVSDLRTSLEKLKAFLDAEERALENADQFTREQTLKAYMSEAAPRLVERMNLASKELANLVGGLSDEQHASYRGYYKSQLLPLILHSPLLKRAYSKPLGYAGDYEMMNMLYREHAEGDSLFGKVMNLYAAQEPAGSATVNRLDYLAQRLETSIEARGRVRVASIGCGPARELALLLERQPELGRYLDVALIDQEERVLSYCERTLSPFAAKTGMKVQFIRESVRRLLTASKLKDALGERDLIYSAGLFDYLNTRSFSALLAVLYDALGPGGQLCVGNFGSENPSRYFMEYGLDWYLIHRSPAELLEFARGLTPAPVRADVDAEPSGINLFLRVWK